MKITTLRLAFASAMITAAASPAFAQTRTPWQMHDGVEVTATNPLGLLAFSCAPSRNGDICEYDVVPGIAAADDPRWRPAPNGDTIGMDIACGGSRVCQAPGGQTCLRYGDFTYFQTFVDVPANVVVTQFTISMNGMDDGARISIFNSANPGGLVVPGSYVFIGGSGTSNLAPYVVAGEVNRVVITQVDDCCCENHLHEARVVLNGQVVQTGCTVTGCDDANACTTDVCNADGSCSHTTITCNDGDACTDDACNPANGCEHRPMVCDDGNGCTIDFCADGACQAANQCPDCSRAAATLGNIWPPNHKMVEVGVTGVTDPQNQSTAIAITGVTQDEPTNGIADGDTCADAAIRGATTLIRAERAGSNKVPGNGRVYRISFTATDPDGYMCSGQVTSCVPHDQGNRSQCIEDARFYDSLVCQ